jgi:Nose resistant-to-fluoxetine protein, N-terminal domain
VTVFDSSAKIPADGALDATIFIQVGNYDQCIATSGPEDGSGAPKFKGKYCIFRPGFQGQQIETLNETIASSLEIQTLVQQTLVCFFLKL